MYSARQELSVEGLQPLGALPRSRTAGGARHWTRERLTTTPGKLALLSVVLAVGAVAFGVIASIAERSRARAAHAVAAQTEPLLLQSVLLYTALSDANATATETFLSGGLEPPARRAHYLADIRLASDSLTNLTRELGNAPGAGAAARTIGEQLPVYSGRVEAARANNRQGFPVGAAYLRRASALLTRTILPEANRVYATEAGRLHDNYAAGTAATAVVVLVVVVGLALVLLMLAQLYLAGISRRIFNVPIVVATVMLAAVSIWAIAALISEQDSLASARRGSDAVEVLSASRVLLSRAQSDQSLILANRGSDQTDPADFAVVMRALAPNGGLLGEVSRLAGPDLRPADVQRLSSEFRAYQAETARISALERSGLIGTATGLGSSSSIAGRLDADLSSRATTAQVRFAVAASDATSSLAGLSIVVPVLAVLGGALAVFGVRQRLGEYR